MPPPDTACKVINAKSGYVRDNSSWVIGRIVRDYEHWMSTEVFRMTDNIIQKAREGKDIQVASEITQKGLTVAVYEWAQDKKPGVPDRDALYWSGFVVALVQLGIAAIPLGMFGDWGIMMITIAGMLLALASGSLSQWKKEKWACRRQKKDIVLTRGNGSQHAILILGGEVTLDLEDLAAAQISVNETTGKITRLGITVLAVLWVLLLITAAGLVTNTWFLLAIGGVGILQNVTVAGMRRKPGAFGVHLKFKEVFAYHKTMQTLYKIEEKYPQAGRSMLATFFPGDLRPDEEVKWADFKREVEVKKKAKAMEKAAQK